MTSTVVGWRNEASSTEESLAFLASLRKFFHRMEEVWVELAIREQTGILRTSL